MRLRSQDIEWQAKERIRRNAQKRVNRALMEIRLLSLTYQKQYGIDEKGQRRMF